MILGDLGLSQIRWVIDLFSWRLGQRASLSWSPRQRSKNSVHVTSISSGLISSLVMEVVEVLWTLSSRFFAIEKSLGWILNLSWLLHRHRLLVKRSFKPRPVAADVTVIEITVNEARKSLAWQTSLFEVDLAAQHEVSVIRLLDSGSLAILLLTQLG